MKIRFTCPKCKWDFARRKNKCCPGCSARLVLRSDSMDDWPTKDFYYTDRSTGWVYVDDWQKHMKAGFQKYADYMARQRAECEGRLAWPPRGVGESSKTQIGK